MSEMKTEGMRWQLVVLDDDPTGIQTVHGCLLMTKWDEESVRQGFQDAQPFFYILTNTRAMTREEAGRVTREAMEMVVRVNRDFGYRLIVVSRSDSCLRGHFPLETDVMRRVLSENGLPVYPKTPFCPAFIEAGRFTIDGVHYMHDGQRLVPVSETEFARDNVFAYHTSVLRDYIKEKGADPDDYEIVNAQSYEELRRWWSEWYAALPACAEGHAEAPCSVGHAEASCAADCAEAPCSVVIRSSSSLPKVISGIADKPLLDGDMLQQSGVGCFVVGSHVKMTTAQLDCLLQAEGTRAIEVDVQRILDDADALMLSTTDTIRQVVDNHLTPVIYTSRQEVRLADTDQRQHLGQQISRFLVELVRRLPFTPAYLVGKGGITSHDILTKGLGISVARVMGQVENSVPCVMTSQGFPYIIFPGNVGTVTSLRDVYKKLNSTHKLQ